MAQMTNVEIERLMDRKRNRRGNRLKLFSDMFPWLLIPVLAYSLLALAADGTGPGGAPPIANTLEAAVMQIPMLSGVTLTLHWGDLLVIFAVFFLFVEVIKSTNTASPTIVNHILSMLLFVICLMQFLMFGNFATATYFIITSIVLLDALAGMVVTIISARRDFGVEGIGT